MKFPGPTHQIVLVILEHSQTQCLNLSVRRVRSDHVDLVIDERAIEQPQIHRAWCACETEPVCFA